MCLWVLRDDRIPGLEHQQRRAMIFGWSCPFKQIRHWWKSAFARAKRLHIPHELIHTKFPICTFDILILFSFYWSSDTNCLALTYRPRQCKSASFMYLTSLLRDLTNSSRRLVIRELTQGWPQGQQWRQKTVPLLVEWGKYSCCTCITDLSKYLLGSLHIMLFTLLRVLL